MSKPHAPKTPKPPKRDEGDQPEPEDDFGGGDFVSPEVSPPTEDDKPLE